MAEAITPQELRTLLEGATKPTLLDVRRKVDFDAAPHKIGDAVWRDPEKTEEWAPEIPDDRPVIVYCVKGGSVSQSVADQLLQSRPDVRYLQGGMKEWSELGEDARE